MLKGYCSSMFLTNPLRVSISSAFCTSEIATEKCKKNRMVSIERTSFYKEFWASLLETIIGALVLLAIVPAWFDTSSGYFCCRMEQDYVSGRRAKTASTR